MTKQARILHGRPVKKLPDIGLGQFVLTNLQKSESRIAQVNAESGEPFTNKDILCASVKLARAFQLQGLNVGDSVSLISENRSNWFIPVCASLFVGATIAPLNPLYAEGEVKHCLNISKPKIIFVSRRTEELITRIVKTLPWSVKLIELDDESLCKNVPTLKKILEDVRNCTDPLTLSAASIPNPEKQEAVILYSSGTTGVPKGVMLSHSNILAFLLNMPEPEFIAFEQDDRLIVFMPFFHGYAFGLILGMLIFGIQIVFLHSFEPKLFLESIQKYRITHVPLVPPIMIFLSKHPMIDHYDLSSVKEIICGAAPLSEELQQKVLKRLGVPCVRNGYGMTELTVVTHLSPKECSKSGTVGKIFPGLSGKIVDPESSKLLEPYKVGELWVKGPQVMLGYRDDSQATLETVDKDGWLHTGDLGYYDEDGYLYIVDRLKELIKYKGYQVAPAEIENILLSHPEILDVGVIGKPDEVAGEVPAAYVVKHPGSKISASEICQFVNGQLSPQKWLRGGVYFVESIPKNPSGKILRKELRRLHSKL